MGMARRVVVLPFVMRYYRGGTRVGRQVEDTGCDTPSVGSGPQHRGRCDNGRSAVVDALRYMPGQVAPPEGFGPCAIAGERLTAATRARAGAPQCKAFISDLRWMNVSASSSRSARFRRSGDQR